MAKQRDTSKPIKVQAREVQAGDIVVATRTSSEGFGTKVMQVSKHEGRIILEMSYRDPDASPLTASHQSHAPRNDVYVIRKDDNA